MTISRRSFLKFGAMAGAGLALPLGTLSIPMARLSASSAVLSPSVEPCAVPLSVPPVLKPVRTNFGTDYYEMTQKVARQEILPGLDTEVWGYDGVFPGPTIRVLGGAMARVSADATAFAHRTSRIMVNVAAVYERPDEAAVHEDWITGFAALRQGDGGAYVNFLGNEGEARIRAAYPESTWERLAEIKGRYDPTNLFRLNQNIPPRPVATGTDTRGEARVRHA